MVRTSPLSCGSPLCLAGAVLRRLPPSPLGFGGVWVFDRRRSKVTADRYRSVHRLSAVVFVRNDFTNGDARIAKFVKFWGLLARPHESGE